MATTAQNFSNVARQQRMFAAACSLAAGAGPAKAARAAKCSRTTLYTWMARPEFQELCQRASEQRNRTLVAKQSEVYQEIVSHLQDLLRSPKTLAAKIRAAQAVMTLAGWKPPDSETAPSPRRRR